MLLIGVPQRRHGPAGATVDIDGAGSGSVDAGRDPLRTAAGTDVLEQQPPRRGHEAAERRRRRGPRPDERRDALDPQHLVLADVADARERSLVEQRLRDRESGSRRVAEPAHRLAGIEFGCQQVRPEPAEARVECFGALLEQLDDRGIEADRHGARHLEDEPGPRWRPAPSLARPVAVPRAVHPQVRPDDEAVVEPDQQVLAERLDGGDVAADHPPDLGDRSRPAGPCRGDGPAHEVWPKARRGPEERVAFGHSGVRRQRGDAGGTGGHAQA